MLFLPPRPPSLRAGGAALSPQRIETVLETGTGAPENGGMLRPLNAFAMQLPVGVPAKGAPTEGAVPLPLGWNVTWTLVLPVGPSAFLQPDARPAAPLI